MTHQMTQYEPALLPRDAAHASRIPPDDLPAPVGRAFSDTYALWCLCDGDTCRRAGRCAGDPQHCLETLLPLVSDDVFDEGRRMFEAQLDGLSFDELLHRYPDGLPSLSRWTLAVTKRVGTRRRRAGRRRAAAAAAMPERTAVSAS